jgi:hypothetical protein
MGVNYNYLSLFKTFFLVLSKELQIFMDFFFIVKSPNSTKLERIIVEGILKNSNNLDNQHIEDDDVINQMLSLDNNTVKERYISKLNKNYIYFKEQFVSLRPKTSNKNNEIYTHYTEIDFLKILDSIKFFFREDIFREVEDFDIDKYKVILSPNNFIEIIDNSIERALSINKNIVDNYSYLTNKDLELLNKKNEILLGRQISDFDKIFQIIKEREKISYFLLDVDVELSNVLVNLNTIKFFKIVNQEPIIHALNQLKELIDIIADLEITSKKIIKI